MNKGIANIWDGNEFRQVPWEEAEQLEKEDKAQNLSARIIGGNELKYRNQFTGYMTRELRAEIPPTAVVAVDSAKPLLRETEALEEGAAVVEALDWKDYKEAFKTATGAKRANKPAVEEWMRNEGIL